MRLLLVEDSTRLQAALGSGLRKAGYVVDISGDGLEGLWLAESNDYDTIILDLMLPGLDGLSVLRRLRKGAHNQPVIILTARDAIEDRVRGLGEGADDYLVKPFAFAELLARIQTQCRRRYDRKTLRLVCGDLTLDAASKTARRGERALKLTAREFMLLEYLALRQGEVVSRTEIEQHLYGEASDMSSNAVDSAVCILRRKLGAGPKGPAIRTRRGQGYVLEAKQPSP